MTQGEIAGQPDIVRGLAEMGARIDRLPLTRVQWELAILTQVAWGLIVWSTDGIAAVLYPFIWKPEHLISSFEYSTIYAFEVGFGILIGDYAMGVIADRFGRRPAIAAAALIAGLLLWPFALVTNFWGLLILSLFSTMGVGAILATHAVYTSEVTSPEVRGRVLFGSQGTQSIILVITGIMAYYMIPDHYKLYLYILAAALVALAPILYWRLPESPRWLESRERHKEADVVLSKMEARVTRYAGPLETPDPSNYPLLATEHVPWHEVLTNALYRPRTILLLTVWVLAYGGLVYGFASYALVYMVEHGAGSQYVFLLRIVAGVLTFFAFIVMARVGEKIERRDAQLGAAILMVIAIFAMYWWPNKVIFDIFYCVTAIAALVWLFTMYNYTALAYPTRVRAVGVGMTDGVGHIGAWGGGQIAGQVYSVGPNHLGWILVVAIPGALLPAALIRGRGIPQREAVMEQLST